VSSYDGGKLSPDKVLVVGPGGGRTLASQKSVIADWLRADGHLLAIGLDQEDGAFLPFQLATKRAEHISAFFEPPSVNSLLAGVCRRTCTIVTPRAATGFRRGSAHR